MNLAAVALLGLLLAAGCGSSGIGDVFGSGNSVQTLHGTVDQADPSSQSILLTNVSDYGSSLSSGGNRGGTGNNVRIYYDDRTTVDYQGRNYRPSDLERGDQVDVRYTPTGSSIVAESMTVTYNVAASGGYPGGNTVPGSDSSVRGTVQYVDTSRQTIRVNTGSSNSGQVTTLQYDANTSVSFNGRSYRLQDLERGDQVDITVRTLGNGALVAKQISVLASKTGGGNSDSSSTVQGTVNSVDTARRTIQLTQTTWGRGFTTGNNGSTVTLQYDQSSYVDYQGQSFPPTNLERGDVISAQVRDLGAGNYLAGRITVLRNARG
jgi:hypothetical protein